MELNCPICERQPLEHSRCPRCGGTWVDVRNLEALPGGPSVKPFLRMAEHLPGRCRRAGHPVSRALVKCATCSSDPALCPACGARLVRIPTRCAIDLCPSCHGIWLDAGELEALKAPVSPARLEGWEIPEPSAPAPDPWLSPGQSEPMPSGGQSVNTAAPFSCRHCEKSLRLAESWAFHGDIYCGACRPTGAVSSHELPREEELVPWSEERSNTTNWGFRLLEFLGNLARRI
jgi:Zn-finger nucleic acid-binding protein